MATVTLHGSNCHTIGDLPETGSKAPDFRLVTSELKDVNLQDFPSKRKLLSIVPSLDTGTCAKSTHVFNERAQEQDAYVLVVSADLPFAMSRFCSAEGLERVVTLSMMRDRNFAKDYGTLLVDGPLEGVSGRAVVVLDKDNTVLYSQLVSEIGDEPDYEGALAALQD